MSQRVLITGIGWLTPLGCGVEEVWSALLEGRCGIASLKRFDASSFATRIAGELKDFRPERWMETRKSRRLDRFVQYALAAGQLAMDDAGLRIPVEDPYRVGVIVGSGAGGMETVEHGQTMLLNKGPSRVPPLSIPRMMINASSSHLACRFGLRGATFGVAQACATGALALAQASDWIASGRADVMLAGGSEASITPLSVAAFSACGALSKRNDDPQKACRPFDRDRDGFVMSEGGCVLVLESEEHALRRGAKVYAELAGSGLTSDVHHITAPDPEGLSAARAIEFALASAGEDPSAVGYINAHGTGTKMNATMESRAIRRALGSAADHAPVSATKSMLGHMLGGAGAVEAAITALALRERKLPRTLNLENQDPECDLDIVVGETRAAPGLRLALSNAFAFGGHNVTLALRRWES